MGVHLDRSRRRLPAWLVGFAIAAVVFVIVLVVSMLLGFGDDPVVEGMARLRIPG